MVSPVQFSNNSQVYFRANDDLISSPGSYQQQAVPETPADEVVLSTQEESPKKKGSIGKTIAYVVGGLVVTAGALFGLFKWKGDKWLNPAAEGTMGKLKNYLVKPGEWLDKQGKALLEKCGIGKKPTKPATDGSATPTAEPKPAAPAPETPAAPEA